MLKIMILVCSANVSPADCQPDTALDVISGPQVSNLVSCGLLGQTQLATTSLGGIRRGEYVKIRCEPVGHSAQTVKTAQRGVRE